ncbi:MAG: hypothetical protein E3J72_13175 [Planctomycetota bacterium]|nr:MAG: hypothetical protein E3J72_13175 [Planctomycetota bacterium]
MQFRVRHLAMLAVVTAMLVASIALLPSCSKKEKETPFYLQPKYIGWYNTPGTACGVFVVGNLAYVADGSAGFSIVDISDPTSPSEVRTIPMVIPALDICVAGNYAYIATGESIAIYDVSVPGNTSTTPVSNPAISGAPVAVQVVNNNAFVAAESAGMVILDISDPSSPVLMGAYNPTTAIEGVFVEGTTAYLAGNGKFYIVDVTDVTLPALTGEVEIPYSGVEVRRRGTYALVTFGSGGLGVIDISDPAVPEYIGRYGTIAAMWGLDLLGMYAYIADDAKGMHIADISDPENITPVKSVGTGGSAKDIVVSGGNAYVADSIKGLIIFDATP